LTGALLAGALLLLGAGPQGPPAPQGSASAGVPAGPPLGAAGGGELLPYLGLLSGGLGAVALGLAVQARARG
jgi:hypothetical protein